MNADIEKSKKAVQDLIKQKYNPELYEAEQEDLKKSKILFKTDPLHPRGWTKN